MRGLLVCVCSAMLLVAVGCKSDDNGDNGRMKSDRTNSSNTGAMNRASNDACAHCPGVQVATKDGKCPSCGMKVSQK